MQRLYHVYYKIQLYVFCSTPDTYSIAVFYGTHDMYNRGMNVCVFIVVISSSGEWVKLKLLLKY